MPTGIANQRESTGMPQPPGQANAANADGGNSVHQAASGTSMAPSSAREAEVRVVPIRTLVAAVPAHIGRLPSDSSRGSLGLLYPVLARVQRVTSGNSNGARGSQASDEHHPSGLVLEQQPIPGSAGQQQSSTYTVREGKLPVILNRCRVYTHMHWNLGFRFLFPDFLGCGNLCPDL